MRIYKTYKKIILFAFLLASPFMLKAVRENKLNIDTTGFSTDLKQATLLLNTDAKASMQITYQWDTKFAKSRYYQEYAEISILHAINNFHLHSAYNSIEVLERAIKTVNIDSITPNTYAEMLAMLGMFYNETGEVNMAVNKIIEAQKLFETNGNQIKYYWTFSLLGKCYSKLDLNKKATENIDLSIKNLKSLGAKNELCDAYLAYFNNALIYYDYQSDWEIDTVQMRLYLNETLLVSRSTHDKMTEGLVYCYYGAYMRIMKDTVASITYYEQAIKVLAETNNRYYLAQARLDYGFSLVRYAKTHEAIVQLELVKEEAAEYGWLDILQKAYSFLASANYALGNFEMAADYAGKSFTYKKYISNTKRQFEMDAQLANAEKEKQELLTQQKLKDIEILKKEKFWLTLSISLAALVLITLIVLYVRTQKSNRALKKLSDENVFLLAEANHRIKNNLQLIVSLMAREMTNATPEKKAGLMDIATKIESISSLHKLLYMKKDKEVIDLSIYIHNIKDNMFPLLLENNISLTCNFDPINYKANDAVYVGLMFNELLVNSIKHAFEKTPNEKIITVELKQNNGTITFNYSDNGIGLKEGVSLKLIVLLAKQLKKEYTITGTNGFYFTIVI